MCGKKSSKLCSSKSTIGHRSMILLILLKLEPAVASLETTRKRIIDNIIVYQLNVNWPNPTKTIMLFKADLQCCSFARLSGRSSTAHALKQQSMRTRQAWWHLPKPTAVEVGLYAISEDAIPCFRSWFEGNKFCYVSPFLVLKGILPTFGCSLDMISLLQ